MEKNEKYQTYATELVRNVPISEVNYLVNYFMEDAALNMGSKYEKTILDRVIYFVLNDYGYLPVSYICSAFRRGSLGKLADGRLVPKTIHNWLHEVSEEYFRLKEHKEREEYFRVKPETYDLLKYPVGSAIVKKVDWYMAGILSIEDWEKIPLQELAEMIGRGESVTLEKFGL